MKTMMSHNQFLAAFDRLHEEAQTATGLDDFGGIDYHEAMRVFLSAHDRRGCSVAEAEGIFGHVVQILIGRLVARDGLRHNPECGQHAIAAPLFILGLPRTGTTALHHLLSRDRQFQTLEYWIARRPQIRPHRDEWQQHAEYMVARDEIADLYSAIPAFRSIHHMAADEGDECRMIMQHTFCSTALAWTWDIPEYSEWLYAQDLTPQYRYYPDVLRLIGANEPSRTWLLKCPHHLMSIEAMLRVFPEARIVFTHRDPVDAIPSLASLSTTLKQWPADAIAQRHAYGHHIANELDACLQRAITARKTAGERILDVRFKDFREKPIKTVNAIYNRFALAHSEEGGLAMQLWLNEQNAAIASGAHRYTLDDFGLAESDVRRRFSYYSGF